MKRIIIIKILLFCFISTFAQKINLISNGYNSTFTKIDTLFLNEYSGNKEKLQLVSSDKI